MTIGQCQRRSVEDRDDRTRPIAFSVAVVADLANFQHLLLLQKVMIRQNTSVLFLLQGCGQMKYRLTRV